VSFILQRLEGFADEQPEVIALKADLAVRYNLSFRMLVSRLLEELFFPGRARDDTIRRLQLLCACYGQTDENRERVRAVFAVPSNIPRAEKLVDPTVTAKYKPRKLLFDLTWGPDQRDEQLRAVSIVRGLAALFASNFTAPLVATGEGRFAYPTVEDCIAQKNRL
jgi:hypothetical protein